MMSFFGGTTDVIMMEESKLFGTSGIRGIVNEKITPQFVLDIGNSIAAMAGKGARVCIGHDARTSSPLLKNIIISALVSSGVNVTDLKMVPTPVLAFATRKHGFDVGVMITASHNPPEYNGIKLYNNEGVAFSKEEEKRIEGIFSSKKFIKAQWNDFGRINKFDVSEDYIRDVKSRISLDRKFSIMIDPGNGAGCSIVPRLFKELGCEVKVVNSLPDGSFSNRFSEPKEENLQATIRKFMNSDCELCVCLDGDGDRTTFIDRQGFIQTDFMAAFFAGLRTKHMDNKKVVTSVDASHAIPHAVKENGGEVFLHKVGDTFISHEMKKVGAQSGFEPCGHFMLSEFSLSPDPVYGTCWILSKIKSVAEIRDFIDSLPEFHFKRESLKLSGDCCKLEVMGKISNLIREGVEFQSFTDIDGFRLDFKDKSWVLIRPSGTEPIIRYSAEAMSRETLLKRLDFASILIKKCMG